MQPLLAQADLHVVENPQRVDRVVGVAALRIVLLQLSLQNVECVVIQRVELLLLRMVELLARRAHQIDVVERAPVLPLELKHAPYKRALSLGASCFVCMGVECLAISRGCGATPIQ